MMDILAQSMNSPLSRRLGTYLSEDDIYKEGNLDCVATVNCFKAFMEQEGSAEHYRPYMRMLGKVERLTGDFPLQVTSVHYADEAHQPNVEFIYRFSNDELAELVKKGLFDDGFATPDVFVNQPLQLPVKVDFKLGVPEYTDDAPLFFINIPQSYELPLDAETCPYGSLAQYFEQAASIGHDIGYTVVSDYADDVKDLMNEEEKPHFTASVVPMEEDITPALSPEEAEMQAMQDAISDRVDKRLADMAVEHEALSVYEDTDEEPVDDAPRVRSVADIRAEEGDDGLELPVGFEESKASDDERDEKGEADYI